MIFCKITGVIFAVRFFLKIIPRKLKIILRAYSVVLLISDNAPNSVAIIISATTNGSNVCRG